MECLFKLFLSSLFYLYHVRHIVLAAEEDGTPLVQATWH